MMITINNKKYNSVEELISTYVPHTIKSPIIRVKVDDREPIIFIVPDEIGYNLEKPAPKTAIELYNSYVPLACGLVANLLESGYYYIYLALDREEHHFGTIAVRKFEPNVSNPEAYIWNLIIVNNQYILEPVDFIVSVDDPLDGGVTYSICDETINQAVSELAMQTREPWDKKFKSSQFVSKSLSLRARDGKILKRHITAATFSAFRMGHAEITIKEYI